MSNFTVNVPTLQVASSLSLTSTASHAWQGLTMPQVPSGTFTYETRFNEINASQLMARAQTLIPEAPLSPVQKAEMVSGGIFGVAATAFVARALFNRFKKKNQPNGQAGQIWRNSANQKNATGKKDENGSKNAKFDVYDTSKNPITLADIEAKFKELFPGEEFVMDGNFDTGLVIYSTANDLHLLAVPSSALIPSAYEYVSHGRITKVTFGGQAKENHLKYSIIELPNKRSVDDIAKCVAAILSNEGNIIALHEHDKQLRAEKRLQELILNGALQVGFERELWALDPFTGELAKIRDDELLVGAIEIDEGLYITPTLAAIGMADKQKELEDKYPGRLLVNMSTPPSGSPRNTELNMYNEPEKEVNLGPYIAFIEGICYPRYKPFTSESLQIREQQAIFHGYPGALEMIAENGDCRTWSTAAAHMNLGVINTYNPETGKYEVNFDLAKNLSNIALSELGSIARIITASSPYITGVAPKINGKFTRDTREFIRQDMGTALSHNEPIRDAKHYQEIVRANMTAGKDGADRLARAIVSHTNEDGSYTATAHGGGRWRFEDTGSLTGRIEYTGAGSTSILPKVRSMAILQMLQSIALLATHEGKDVFDYIKENFGYSKEEVLGNADGTVQEFFLNGPQSPRMQKLAARLTDIFEQMHVPGLEDSRQIALAALRDIQVEGDLHDLAKGKGTLGGALLKYAQQGYSGLQVAKIVHAFQQQEAKFIRTLSEDEVKQYLRGEIGFEFIMPNIKEPVFRNAA